MTLASIKLKPREDRRLRAGHQWVFSNEVDVATTPLAGFMPGQQATVLDGAGKTLGTAFVNPNCLICARLVSRTGDAPLDAEGVDQRIAQAIECRARLAIGRCGRLIYGESDALPGLVVDRHGDVLVVQVTSAGMALLENDIVASLLRRLSPRAVLLRNDGHGRQLEGLPRETRWAHGGPICEPVRIEENGALFDIDVVHGQKTGWFYDHRSTRARAAAYAHGARVLDLFCYLGGFAVQTACAGAESVLAIDSSDSAVAGVARNAQLNGVAARIKAERGDVFDVLKHCGEAKRRFDLVVVDPPAFARRKRDLKPAMEAYRRLNRLAMGVLAPNGVLVSASCSSHLSADQLLDCLRLAGQGARRDFMVLETGGQGPDHPVHPAMAETRYLKSFIVIARG